MRVHALMAERTKEEMDAALKIQTAYRGYNVRKSFKWGDPPPKSPERPQPPIIPQTMNSEASTSVNITSSVTTTTTTTIPVATHSAVILRPPSVPEETVEPWKQTGGGDNHSVINIFTRQHQQLQDTLSQLSDRRRDEIRSFSSQLSPETTPKRSTADQPLRFSEEQITHKQSPPSYTPTFDQTPPTHDVVSLHSGSTVSFSQDSLYSNPSPPRSGESRNSHSQSHTPQNLSTHSLDSQQTPPSKQGSNLSDKSVSTTINAITPPGSLSFVDSFSSPPHPPSHVPPATGYTERVDGRVSPRSLELQHQAQLNHYEMVEQNLHHLTLVERTRDLSVAQQETVTLAQQLKAQEQVHKNELSELANKAKLEIVAMKKRVESDSMYSSERLRQLQEKADSQTKEHAKRLAELQQDSERAAQEATLRLNEARSAATNAVIESAQQQVHTAHSLAISAATAATKEAVREALRYNHGSPSKTNEYESDFDPSTTQPESDIEKSDAHENTGSSKDTTLTPAFEEEEGAQGSVLEESHDSSTHEVTEDIDEEEVPEDNDEVTA